MKHLLAALFMAYAATASTADGYVFVSTTMPKSSLVSLAKEASLTGFTLVLNGFGQGRSQEDAARFAIAINKACCSTGKSPTWITHPPLFERHQIKAVPSFVVSLGGQEGEYTRISGDIGLAQALKYISQNSTNLQIKAIAIEAYTKAFKM